MTLIVWLNKNTMSSKHRKTCSKIFPIILLESDPICLLFCGVMWMSSFIGAVFSLDQVEMSSIHSANLNLKDEKHTVNNISISFWFLSCFVSSLIFGLVHLKGLSIWKSKLQNRNLKTYLLHQALHSWVPDTETVWASVSGFWTASVFLAWSITGSGSTTTPSKWQMLCLDPAFSPFSPISWLLNFWQ